MATVSGQLEAVRDNEFLSGGIAWGYINHRRVTQLSQVERLSGKAKDLFEYCRAKGMVDADGIIIQPPTRQPGRSPLQNTVYDWFPFGDDHRLHKLYTALVDQVASGAEVIHLEPPSWSKSDLKDLAKPGCLVFVTRPFYFKTVTTTVESEHRRCKTIKGKLSLEFFVDTIDMFGTTSITVSFTGYRTCSALALVKDLEETANGGLVIHATPIALGVGFQRGA